MFLREVSIKDKTINNSYVYDIPMIQAFNSLSFNKPVTFLCGENGTGKSTLLEAIAIAYGFNPEGGSRNLMFSTCDTHSPLADNLRMVKGLKTASFCGQKASIMLRPALMRMNVNDQVC